MTLRAALSDLEQERVIRRDGRRGVEVLRVPAAAAPAASGSGRKTIGHVFYASSGFDWTGSGNTYFHRLHRGMERYAAGHGGVLMIQTGEHFERLIAHGGFRPDGLLVQGTGVGEKIPALQQLGIPFVVVDYISVGQAVNAVCGDNFEAGFLCGREFARRRKARVLFVDIQFAGEPFVQPNFTIRLEGLKRGLNGAAAVVEHRVPWSDAVADGLVAACGAPLEAVARCERIDAVLFCTSGLYPLALGWLRRLRNAAPAPAMALIDESGLPRGNPALFQVHVNMEQVGYLGCQRLYEQIDTPSDLPMKILVPAQAAFAP